MDDFLSKPFKSSELAEVMAHAVAAGGSARRAVRHQIDEGRVATLVEHVGRDGLSEILTTLQEDATYVLREMTAAMDRADRPAIGHLSRSLGTSCAAAGLSAAATACRSAAAAPYNVDVEYLRATISAGVSAAHA
jgi:hypothetical protein